MNRLLTALVILAATTAVAYEGPTPAGCDPPVLPDASQLSGSCQVTGSGCSYRTPTRYKMLDLGDWTTSYDALGVAAPAQRTIDLKVRVPKPKGNHSPALPVVIVSHGGAHGAAPSVGQNNLDRWAEVLARAGYATINIGHRARTADEREALCTALGIDTSPSTDPNVVEGDCAFFPFLHYDRPHDVKRVLDVIDDGTLEAQYGIDLDPSRIAVAGHSAGAGGALMVAGAKRTIGGVARDYSDARPKAFIALSPQQPLSDPPPPDRTSEGFEAASWATMLDRPVFTATGAGDDVGQEDPWGRRDTHYFLASDPQAPRYQLFICDSTIKHTNFSLEQTGPRHFEELLTSSALAFLDAVLRGLPDARAWIDHENASAWSAGRAEWNARTWTPVELDTFVYVAGSHRRTGVEVPLNVWYPDGLTGSLPVVLWSHGGSPVTTEFNNLGEAWMKTLASAGYAAIKVNTLDRQLDGPDPDLTHCTDYGYADGTNECTALGWACPLRDRALDAIAALGALPAMTLPSGATLDPSRVAVGGWSGGSGMPLALGGATRDLTDPVCPFAPAPTGCDANSDGSLHPVPRNFTSFDELITTPAPVAVLALSPPGGYAIGLFRKANHSPSYDEITLPLFVATGAGDTKDDVEVADRLLPYDTAAASRQFQLFINSADASHDTFNLGNDAFPQYNHWVAKTTVAFLDAIVKRDAALEDYLYSDAIRAMVEGDPTVTPDDPNDAFPPAWRTR